MVYLNNVTHKGPTIENAFLKIAGSSSAPFCIYDRDMNIHINAYAQTYPSPQALPHVQ